MRKRNHFSRFYDNSSPHPDSLALPLTDHPLPLPSTPFIIAHLSACPLPPTLHTTMPPPPSAPTLPLPPPPWAP